MECSLAQSLDGRMRKVFMADVIKGYPPPRFSTVALTA